MLFVAPRVNAAFVCVHFAAKSELFFHFAATHNVLSAFYTRTYSRRNIKAFKESAQHVRIIERKKAARRRFFVSACGVCIHAAESILQRSKVLLASNLHALHTQNIISLLFCSLSRKVRLSRTRMDKWSEICYLCAKNNKIFSG